MGSDLGHSVAAPIVPGFCPAGPVEKIVPNLRPPALKDAMEVTVEHLEEIVCSRALTST
jgi:hypothetical protein